MFTSIPLSKLLLKLRLVGVHHMIVNWIREFLSERTYQVKVNGQFSEIFKAFNGVPQGEFFPLCSMPTNCQSLFHDLELFVKKIYADDIKTYKTIESTDDLYAVQEAVNYIDSWADKWELPLAAGKSKCFVVGTSRTVETPS